MIDVMINIDCRDGMKSIPDKSIDMVCTDLPYGITRNKWDTPDSSLMTYGGALTSIIKDNGANYPLCIWYVHGRLDEKQLQNVAL